MRDLPALKARIQQAKQHNQPVEPRDVEAAVAHANAARDRGMTQKAISQELGITPVTLSRWRARARVELRPVEVVDSAPPERHFTVLGPSGLRIEGVTLEQARALLGAQR